MYSCVIPFRLRYGEGTQTVTGVTDVRTGLPFTGKYFQFQSGNVLFDTLAWRFNGGSPDASNEGFNFTIGVDLVGRQYGSVFAAGPLFAPISADGTGSNRFSILEASAGPFVGEQVFAQGHVTAARDGEFDLELFLGINPTTRSDDDWIVTVLGGDDLEVQVNPIDTTPIVGGTSVELGYKPAGILSMHAILAATDYPGTLTATGGNFSLGIGFTVPSGAAAGCAVAATDPNAYLSRSDKGYVEVSTISATHLDTIWSWLPTGYTIQTGTDYFGGSPCVFGGDTIVANCGTITQPTVTGLQTFDCGIDAQWLMFASTNHPANTSITTGDDCNISVGYATGPDQQYSFWSGEPNTAPLGPVGARYMGTNELLRFGVANEGSTTFNSVAVMSDLSSIGTVELDWTSVDGTEREIHWFALGVEAADIGTVEVDKIWTAEEPGQVTLRIGTTPGDDDIASQTTGEAGAAPLTLGPIELDEGTYYVSETDSQLWGITITCTVNGVDTPIGDDGEITVANNDVIVVTITNGDRVPPERPNQWKLYGFNMKLRAEERG
jgi:hypothetical protein